VPGPVRVGSGGELRDLSLKGECHGEAEEGREAASEEVLK
jgi:hypothetical protein